jgi:NADH:ubiquinone oxidoreductase subunit E
VDIAAPEKTMLSEKYPYELKAIFAKYPEDQKRSAVMPLLYLAQREEGYITKAAMKDIAGTLGLDVTEVAAIVGFYTLYHDHQAGKYRMQVCTDLPCALRGADEFSAPVRTWHPVGGCRGLVTLEAVMCLAACDKAPMFQMQSPEEISYHENMTVDKTMELIEALKASGKDVA